MRVVSFLSSVCILKGLPFAVPRGMAFDDVPFHLPTPEITKWYFKRKEFLLKDHFLIDLFATLLL